MKKLWKIILLLSLILALAWFGTVLADRQTLSSDVIRLHVVANSDSVQDQAVKLQVRDAITGYLEQLLGGKENVRQAREVILEHLEKIQALADQVLSQCGVGQTAYVTLTQECFDTREYETFSLPAGVYESLRVTIGQGQGKNWWCVVFPALCSGKNREEFADTAAGSGFEEPLTGSLQGERTYEIRFFLLDWLGRLQNFFHRD